MKAYKRIGLDGTCRGYKYPIGEWVEFPEAKLCEAGAHSCLDPMDTNRYYSPAESELREVEIEDVSHERGDDSKVASKRIKIGAALDVDEICIAHSDYINAHCKNADDHVAGDYESATAGYRGSASAGNHGSASAGNHGSASAGECGIASADFYGSASVGECGCALTGEYGSASAGECGIATAGYNGSASAGIRGSASAGNRGSASAGYRGFASAGDYGSAVSRGKTSVGKNGVACARGNGCMVRGGLNALLVIAEESNYDCDIAYYWKAVVVDGETVKADTWYRLHDGELVEVQEEG